MDPVTICNMALGWLGQRRITSLDEDSAHAELMKDQFEPAVLSVLEAKAWLFATGSKPTDLGDPQETGDANWPVSFTLPGDAVALRAVYDENGDPLDFERREGSVVTKDTAKAFAIYTRFVSDPTKWTPTFCRAVACRLAADNAGTITESVAAEARFEKKYMDEVKKAGTLDGLQGSAVPMTRRGALKSPAAVR